MRPLYTSLILVVMLASMLAPIAVPAAKAQTVLKITTSRDEWGTIYYNQYFYVDILLSSKAGTNITLKVQKNDEQPIEINATYVTGTAYVYRVWFYVDTNGNLQYNTSASTTPPAGFNPTGITLQDGDVLKITYQDKTVSLTFAHKAAEQNIRINVPYPTEKTGTYDWLIVAPDLNKNPSAPDYFVAYVKVNDYTKNKEGYLAIPYEETGPNTGVFKPIPLMDKLSTTTNSSLTFNTTEPLAKRSFYANGYLYNGSKLEVEVSPAINATYNSTTKIIYFELSFNITLKAGSKVIATYTAYYEGEVNTTQTNTTTFKAFAVKTNKAVCVKGNLTFNVTSSTTYDLTYNYTVKLTYEYAYAMLRPYIADQLEPTDYIVVMFYVPVYQGASKGDETTATITVFRTAGEISKVYANIRELYVQVKDASENKKSYDIDTVTVNLTCPNGNTMPITLKETDVDTGIFEAKRPLIKYYVYGSLPSSGCAFNATEYTFKVTYVDPSEGTVRTATFTPEFHTAVIEIQPSQVSLAGIMKVIIKDPDLNLYPGDVDTYVTNLGGKSTIMLRTYTKPYNETMGLLYLYAVDDKGQLHQLKLISSHTFVIYETGTDTGVFEVVIPLYKLNTTGIVVTKILVVYKDLLTPQGPQTVKASVPVAKVSIQVDRDVVPLSKQYNVTVHVTVVDPSANSNAYEVDHLKQVDWALCTPDGKIVYSSNITNLPETDVNTGVFVGTIVIPAANITPSLIGGKLCISYTSKTGETAEVEIPLKVYGVELKVNTTKAKYGDVINITLVNPDANVDTASKDKVTVYVNNIPVTLEETGADTGVFTGLITVVGKAVSGVANPIVVEPGSVIVVSYTDKTSPITPRDAGKWSPETRTVVIQVPPHTGVLTVNGESKAVEVGPVATLTITVKDWDLNVDPTAPDKATVYVRMAGLSPAMLTLEETGPNTGVFQGNFTIDDIVAALQKENDVPLTRESLISRTFYIVYRDEATATGEITTLSVPVTVKTWDGVVKTDKEAYNPGEKIKITVIDKDRAGAGTIAVRVYSTSDAIGTRISLVETKPGVFEGEVLISSKPTIESGYIYAKLGDTITIAYTDIYPAGYPQVTSKVITKTVTVGVRPKLPAKVSGFELVNPLTGEKLVTAKVGQLVSLQVTVENHDIVKRTMTVMAVVRDARGVTVYITYTIVELEPGKSITVGLGWVPTKPGTYTVEIEVVKSLKEPVSLAELAHYTITVEQA